MSHTRLINPSNSIYEANDPKGMIMTRTSTPALFAIACLLTIPTVAQAGYRDGMSVYPYYAGMRGGLDPTGLWEEPDRRGSAFAETISDNGDNKIQTLADMIRLNASEVSKWIQVDGGVLEVTDNAGAYQRRSAANLQPSDEVCPGQIVSVPNTVGIYLAGRPVKDISFTVTGLQNTARNIKKTEEANGYHVVFIGSGTSDNDFKNLWRENGITMVVFAGHGSNQGVIADYRHGTAVNPNEVRPPYHLSQIGIFACQSANPVLTPNFGPNGQITASWRKHLSDKGVFIGFDANVHLFNKESCTVIQVGPGEPNGE